MNITVFRNYSKKTDSTARPSNGQVISVRLKEPTDELNPIFILGIDTEITEVYWNGKYYFKSNLVFITNDLMELHCRIDPLATAKDFIVNHITHVSRASSRYDVMINDQALSQTQEVVHESMGVTSMGATLDQPGIDITGCYVVRCIGRNGTNSSTGICEYAIEVGDLYKLVQYCFTESNYDFLNDVQNSFIKAVFNPFEYIIDVKWVPFDIDTLAPNGTQEVIWFGWWSTTDLLGYKISAYGVVIERDLTLPTFHYNDFRKYNAQFTKVNIMLPFVGLVSLDPIELSLGTLGVIYVVDFTTFQGTCYLRTRVGNAGTHKYIGKYQCNYSAQVQLAQSSTDLKKIASSSASAMAYKSTGNYRNAFMEGFEAVTALIQPDVDMLGTPGTIMDLKALSQIQVCEQAFDSKDFPTSVYGRPLNEVVQLGSLSGYVKCSNASLDLPYPIEVREQVNQLLNSGFYME